MEQQLTPLHWIRSNYCMAYSKCLDYAKTLDPDKRYIWFDPRYWDEKQITEFFDDLHYADPHTYECVRIRLPDMIHNRRAEKRYKEWKKYEEAWLKEQS